MSYISVLLLATVSQSCYWHLQKWKLGLRIEVGAIEFRRHKRSWGESSLSLGAVSLMLWEEGQGVSMNIYFLRARGRRF